VSLQSVSGRGGLILMVVQGYFSAESLFAAGAREAGEIFGPG
jgi:hypothetical protein